MCFFRFNRGAIGIRVLWRFDCCLYLQNGTRRGLEVEVFWGGCDSDLNRASLAEHAWFRTQISTHSGATVRVQLLTHGLSCQLVIASQHWSCLQPTWLHGAARLWSSSMGLRECEPSSYRTVSRKHSNCLSCQYVLTPANNIASQHWSCLQPACLLARCCKKFLGQELKKITFKTLSQISNWEGWKKKFAGLRKRGRLKKMVWDLKQGTLLNLGLASGMLLHIR